MVGWSRLLTVHSKQACLEKCGSRWRMVYADMLHVLPIPESGNRCCDQYISPISAAAKSCCNASLICDLLVLEFAAALDNLCTHHFAVPLVRLLHLHSCGGYKQNSNRHTYKLTYSCHRTCVSVNQCPLSRPQAGSSAHKPCGRCYQRRRASDAACEC